MPLLDDDFPNYKDCIAMVLMVTLSMFALFVIDTDYFWFMFWIMFLALGGFLVIAFIIYMVLWYGQDKDLTLGEAWELRFGKKEEIKEQKRKPKPLHKLMANAKYGVLLDKKNFEPEDKLITNNSQEWGNRDAN